MRGFSSSVRNRFKKCKKKDQVGYGNSSEHAILKKLDKKSKKRRKAKSRSKPLTFTEY